MKTGCFKWYKENHGVAICLRPPISWKGECFKELAPPLKTFIAIKNKKISETQYEYEYRNLVLSKINPYEIISRFKNNVLLCWEEPIFDNFNNIINKGNGFCHRHIISNFIYEITSYRILEWTRYEKTPTNIQLF